jgi:hypothetical protein
MTDLAQALVLLTAGILIFILGIDKIGSLKTSGHHFLMNLNCPSLLLTNLLISTLLAFSGRSIW